MQNNRPVWIVRDCGIHFDEIPDWKQEVLSCTTELTENEKQSQFARYYFRQITMPSHENLAAAEIGTLLPEDQAVMPEEYVRMMDSPKIEELRSGYRILANGIGYSMTRIVMPGITDEKFQFFNEHFVPEEDLYYKCWYPGMHMKHYIGGCIEDVGLGMELIHFLSGYSLEEFAHIPGYEVKDPRFINFNGGGGVSWPLHNPFCFSRYALQANWWRDLPDGKGRELFISFWFGMKWENGRAVRAIPEGESVNIEYARSHMNHSIWEYTQTATLIRSFWDDYQNRRITL